MGDEVGVEQAATPPPAEALEQAVRPAVVAATRLFRVAGAFLAATGERGEPAWTVAAGDLAEALERAAAALWAGPCQEVLGSGSPVPPPACPTRHFGPTWRRRWGPPASTACCASLSTGRPARPAR